MANEVRFSWVAGQANILADVFTPAGAEREFGVILTETGQGRLYLGDCATIVQGDSIVFHQNGIYLSGTSYEDRTGYKLASDGLVSVSTAEPAADPTTWNFQERLDFAFRVFLEGSLNNGSEIQYMKDDDATPLAKQAVSEVAGVERINKATAP